MVSGTMVDRWLRSAVQDMKENNRIEVLCPCRKCKGIVCSTPMTMVVSSAPAHDWFHGWLYSVDN